jgi:hypothetical protein
MVDDVCDVATIVPLSENSLPMNFEIVYPRSLRSCVKIFPEFLWSPNQQLPLPKSKNNAGHKIYKRK